MLQLRPSMAKNINIFLKKTTMDCDIINYTETIGEANLVANEKKTCLVLDTLRLRNLQSL